MLSSNLGDGLRGRLVQPLVVLPIGSRGLELQYKANHLRPSAGIGHVRSSRSSLAVIHAHPNSSLIAGHEFTNASNTSCEDVGRAKYAIERARECGQKDAGKPQHYSLVLPHSLVLPLYDWPTRRLCHLE